MLAITSQSIPCQRGGLVALVVPLSIFRFLVRAKIGPLDSQPFVSDATMPVMPRVMVCLFMVVLVGRHGFDAAPHDTYELRHTMPAGTLLKTLRPWADRAARS